MREILTDAKIAESTWKDEVKDLNIFPQFELADLNLEPVLIRPITEEIPDLLNIEARFRNGFEIDTKNLVLYQPVVFTKLYTTNTKKEKIFLDKIVEKADIRLILNKENKPYPFETRIWVNNSMELEEDNEYTKLNYQEIVENVLNSYLNDKDGITNKSLKQIKYAVISLYRDIQEVSTIKSSHYLQRVLSVAIALNTNFFKILDKYDYPGRVPTIFVYNKGERDVSMMETLLLLLFNRLGLDVVVYSEENKLDIEKYLSKKYLDIHYLSNLAEIKNKSIFNIKSLWGSK